MNEVDDQIFEQAIAWHFASLREDMDWSGFISWLEADQRHRAAYDEIALTDATLADHADALAPSVDITAARAAGRWPLWMGGALAASLAAILVIPQLSEPQPRTFSSGATSRAVALSDGSQVLLAPHSQLTITGRHFDKLALNGGAFFAVRHDPARELTIGAGGLEIADIGTRFDVQTDDNAVRVEVSEGQIELRGNALGAPVRLLAGKSILFDPAHKLATITPISMRDVGEWREGRLSYDAAPLSLVVADLERYAGISVTMPSSLAGRRFSGTLSIRYGDSAVRDLAQLMGLQLSHGAGGYGLAERR